MFDREMKKTA